MICKEPMQQKSNCVQMTIQACHIWARWRQLGTQRAFCSLVSIFVTVYVYLANFTSCDKYIVSNG